MTTPLLTPPATASTVAITGHRPDSLDGDFTLTSPLWQWVRQTLPQVWAELGTATVIQGMAVGVDQLAGFLALEAELRVHAAIPFAGQDARWPELARRRWRWLDARVHERTVVSDGGYAAWKLHARNEFMVDRADVLVAVWNGKRSGGTGGCVAYAERRGVPIVVCDPVTRTVGWHQATGVLPGL